MLKKILYPLDLKGSSQQNRIDGELHTIGRDRYRAFAVNYGYFYADSVSVRDRTRNVSLVEGVDYECLYYLRSVSELTTGKQRVCGVILITNIDVSTDLEVGYQLVGGHYANYSSAIEEAIALLELDNRNVQWANVLARPDLFEPSPHPHDVGDIYGLEYVIDLLGYIYNAILVGDNEVHNQILQAIDDLRNSLDNSLRMHLTDYNNPHRTTAEQVGAYDKETIDAFLAAISTRFDNLEPRFTDILTTLGDVLSLLAADESAIQGLGHRLTLAETNITKLFAQIGNNGEAIALLEIGLTNANNEITALKAKDLNLQGQITANSNEIAAIKLVNSNQDARLAAIEAKNTEQDTRLDNHDTSLANLNTKFNSYVPWTRVNQGGQTWTDVVNQVAFIQGNGVMEFGKYQDWHDSGSTVDYTLREQVQYNSSVGGYEIYSTGFYNAVDVFIRSDVRDKTDIEVLETKEALAILTKLSNGIRYKLLGKGDIVAGLSAQAVREVFPEAVIETVIDEETKETRYSLRNGALVGLLVSGINELNKRLLALEK